MGIDLVVNSLIFYLFYSGIVHIFAVIKKCINVLLTERMNDFIWKYCYEKWRIY